MAQRQPDIVAFASARSDGGVGVVNAITSGLFNDSLGRTRPTSFPSQISQSALSLHLSLSQLILSISKRIVTRFELDFYWATRNIRPTINVFKIPSIGPLAFLGLLTMDYYTRRVHPP